MWAAPELLGVPNIGGGRARAGGWWSRRFQKSNKPSKQLKYMKMAKKQVVSHLFWPINHRKRRFSLKSTYLTKYTQEMFFEKYVNFQNHYLSHCGLIPVQSFGSHIRPQPHGLGLSLPPRAIMHYERDRSSFGRKLR